MQTIDAAGNVVFWANLDSNGTADRLVLGLTDGNLLIAARRGDPTPIGGTFGSMDAWPAVNGNIGTLNVATPGAKMVHSVRTWLSITAQVGHLLRHQLRRVPLLRRPRVPTPTLPSDTEHSDAKAQANAEASSCCAGLKASYSVVRNNNMKHTLKIALFVVKFYWCLGTDSHY